MSSRRLFIALWPSPAVRSAVLAWSAGCAWPAQARRVAAPRLHLTLHFLGDVPAEHVPGLARALPPLADAFTLLLDGATIWPQGVAVLHPNHEPPELNDLHARLAGVLTQLGLPVHGARLRPHLTLARHAAGARLAPEAPSIRWRVHHYVLVHSTPGPGGGYARLASYRCLAEG